MMMTRRRGSSLEPRASSLEHHDNSEGAMAKVQGIHCATLACGSCSVWWYLVFLYFCVDCEQQQQLAAGNYKSRREEAEMESKHERP